MGIDISLTQIEKDFLWDLACNRHDDAKHHFSKIKCHKNLIFYAMNNRLEIHLENFLKKEGLINRIEPSLINNFYLSLENRVKRNFAINQKALNLLDEYSQNKINYSVLKGLSYTSISRKFNRTLRDIDVLIARDDIGKAVKIANKHGFQFKNHIQFSENMILDESKVYDLPDLIDKNKICLEIHYKIFRESRITPCALSDIILDNKLEYQFFDKTIYGSSPAIALVHLIYHATKKGNFDVGLTAIFDYFFLLDYISNTDKDLVFEITSNFGLIKEAEIFFLLQKENISEEESKKMDIFKNLIFSINANTNIQSLFQDTNKFRVMKSLLKMVFVNKRELNREFNIQPEKGFIMYYFKRGVRQIIQFRYLIYLLVFKRNRFKEKSKLIDEFYL